ncbi:lectin family protein [Besnoitia besnoiti]|uniref:Lectin family protein n=1 Tax=Besnoitia besnoiti TaxID=94643 RepID=A0A2A9MPF4_BESBE|nr:lectin family protein [Besnoitia besnoiti]PFH37917.1 lectin family protein [Besnoitia besnoiti]
MGLRRSASSMRGPSSASLASASLLFTLVCLALPSVPPSPVSVVSSPFAALLTASAAAPPPPPPAYSAGAVDPNAAQGYIPPASQQGGYYASEDQPPVQNYASAEGGYPPYAAPADGGMPPAQAYPPSYSAPAANYAGTVNAAPPSQQASPAGAGQGGQARPAAPRAPFVEGAPHVLPPAAPASAAGGGGASGADARRSAGKPLWHETVGSVELPRHSWVAPLNAENSLGEWDLAMATVPAERYVVLTPAVANRTGQFWHRQALLTSNFEVQFGFSVYGDDKAYSDAANSRSAAQRADKQSTGANGAPLRVGKPEGFAFWYVYEAYAQAFPRTLEEEQEWKLFGYKNRPKGLGVFFKVFDRAGYVRPSISVYYNEQGSRALDPVREIPLPAGIFYRYRNLPEPVVFKLAAGPAGIVGEVRATSGGAWLTCFHLKDVRLKSNGFIGFTAYNGPEAASLVPPVESPDAAARPQPGGGVADLVVLYFVKVWNLDLSVRGESDELLAQEMSDVPVDDLLKGHSVRKDEKALTEALKQLARMMYKHIAEQSPREQAMQRTINALGAQVTRLAADVREMKKEILGHIQKAGANWASGGAAAGEAKDAGAGTEEALHTVRTELHGLKNLLAQHSQIHRDSIHTLQQKVEAARAAPTSGVAPELRELATRARNLEATIAAKEHFSFFMTIGMILVLLAFAFFVWKRFRDMEKKHLL